MLNNYSESLRTKARPFLKWAGGKTQLIGQFQKFYPFELFEHKIRKYIEPFLGGGSIFFDVMQHFNVDSAYISDVNKDLILTYKVIQQKPAAICDYLAQYQKEYDKREQEKRAELFLSVRKIFNEQRFGINYQNFSDNWITRAAQFIFLNKTCFNGLYRLNLKGEFNVPFGKYSSVSIFESKNIFLVSNLLQKAEIREANYKESFSEFSSFSFAYFDPPYKPISKTSNFTNYIGKEFTDKEQIELANFFRKLDSEKEAKLMLSNSDLKNVNPNNNFFEEIYKNFYIHRVFASRSINSNGDKRGKIKEILITNYSNKTELSDFQQII